MNPKLTSLFLIALLAVTCTKRKKQEDLTLRFCEQVSEGKTEAHRCFVDLLECYEKTPEAFDDEDQVFLECARLLDKRGKPDDAGARKGEREKIAAEIISEWEAELDGEASLLKKR